MKIATILCLLTLLASCNGRNKEQPNEGDLKSLIMEIINIEKDFETGGNSGIVGIWRSRSSHTILLVGKDQKAVLLWVQEFGDIVVGSDNSVRIGRSDLDYQYDPIGHLIDGRALKTDSDPPEYFLKVQ